MNFVELRLIVHCGNSGMYYRSITESVKSGKFPTSDQLSENLTCFPNSFEISDLKRRSSTTLKYIRSIVFHLFHAVQLSVTVILMGAD